MSKKIAVYAGTFDPITYGHINIIRKASKLFDEVIVAVAENSKKKTYFNSKTRVRLVNESIKECCIDNCCAKNIDDQLTVHFAKNEGAGYLIRGMRSVTDFEYEFQMNHANTIMDGNIETVFLMSHGVHMHTSSTLVRTMAKYSVLNLERDRLVPSPVITEFKKRWG